MILTRRSAFSIYLIIAGYIALTQGMIFTANLVYQVQTVGLSPLQLVLVGTTLEVTCFILQVPTGILADLFSRRRAVIIGYALMGVGFILEGAIPRFETILLAQVIWGAGVTLVSGAEEAWISDEIGTDRAGQAFVRASQFGAVGGLIGLGVGSLLGSVQINLPIVFGGAAIIGLAGFLALFMPETGFRPVPRHPEQNLLSHAGATLREGWKLVRGHAILISVLAIALCYGLYSEGYDRLWTQHMLTNFEFPAIGQLQPVVWISVMRAGSAILSLTVSEWLRRRVDSQNESALIRVLGLLSTAMVFSLIVFGLAGNFGLALIAFWLFGTARAVTGPFFTTWANRQFPSETRATMHSVLGLVDAAGQIGGGPIVGGWAEFLTGQAGLGSALRITLITVGLILSPVLIGYRRAARLVNDQQSLSQPEVPAERLSV